MAESARRGEARAAQAIIDDFVVRATAQGLAPEPLQATMLDGRSVRTDQRGWYVNRRRSVAIGVDGGWYVLTVPSSLKARFAGIALKPSPPELVVGRGGRDGESGDLSEFLERVLGGR